MKTSNIKSEYSLEQVTAIPAIASEIVQGSLVQLTEGHFSQAFKFETRAGDKRVLRLARKLYSFKADKFAYDHFASADLPVPKVLEIGQAEPELFYCVSEFVQGTPSDQLSPQAFALAKKDMERVFAAIYNMDVSASRGEGDIDTGTGNGEAADFKEVLKAERAKEDTVYLKEQCRLFGIDPVLVEEFNRQFDANIDYGPTTRRLLHGDLGSDNVLVQDGKLTAVLDWGGMAYGDWLHDYSRMEFWYPGLHTPALEFAANYGLETQDFDKRWRAHMAAHALATLQFAFAYESHSTVDWLRQYLPSKLEKQA